MEQKTTLRRLTICIKAKKKRYSLQEALISILFRNQLIQSFVL